MCNILGYMVISVAQHIGAASAQAKKKIFYFNDLIMRMLSGRTLRIDDRTRKCEALAAFWTAPQRGIGLLARIAILAHRSAQVLFANRIADTNYHAIVVPLMRMDCNIKSGWLAIF
jgi:hypothetical protein